MGRPRESGSPSRVGGRRDRRRLSRLASEVGLNVVGASPAGPPVETERQIREPPCSWPLRPGGLHDGAPGKMCVTSRTIASRCEVGGVGRPLLLRAGTNLEARRRATGSVHLAGRIRAELRDALDRLGRHLGGSVRVLSRLERSRRSRGRRSLQAWAALREEHDGDRCQERVWVVGHSRHRRRDRVHTPSPELDCGLVHVVYRRVSYGRARRARGARRERGVSSYSTQAPGPDSRVASLRSSGAASTGATSVGTSAPWNGAGGRGRGPLRMRPRPWRPATGLKGAERSSLPSSSGCGGKRAPAGCDGMRSSQPGTSATTTWLPSSRVTRTVTTRSAP